MDDGLPLFLGCVFVCLYAMTSVRGQGQGPVELPLFKVLTAHYPGFKHFGGHYRNHDIVGLLGIGDSGHLLLHDTTALRFSYTLNKIGKMHSIGNDVVRLSQYGTDSVPDKDGIQYIFHPLAFGPFLADKYGYPTVTKMHLFDPVKTKESFNNKQGVMRVITYTQKDNEPRGHIALWDCDGFYQARDFFYGHTLLSVEFWEATDSDCSQRANIETENQSTEIETSSDIEGEVSDSLEPEDPHEENRGSNLWAIINQTRRRHSLRQHHIRN